MVAAIDMIEQQLQNQFEYHLYMDPGVTGRLEATVIPKAGGEGVLVHSKAASKKYIKDDYETFLTQVSEALK